jgi:hypothetical protein
MCVPRPASGAASDWKRVTPQPGVWPAFTPRAARGRLKELPRPIHSPTASHACADRANPIRLPGLEMRTQLEGPVILRKPTAWGHAV